MSGGCISRDKGGVPIFLILSFFVGFYHICLGTALTFFTEGAPPEQNLTDTYIRLWICVCCIVTGAICVVSWQYVFRETRLYGDILGLLACLNCGHSISAALLVSEEYAVQPQFFTLWFAALLLLGGALMTLVAVWHKKFVRPRDPNDPAHLLNQLSSAKYQVFYFTVGPFATVVYGFAASRLLAGRVPCPYLESLIGFATAGLLLALYCNKYRASRVGSIVTVVWLGVVAFMFALSCVYYAFLPRTTTQDELQLRIEIGIMFINFVLFGAGSLLQVVLLREPLHLFKKPSSDSTRRQADNKVSHVQQFKQIEAPLV